MKTHYIIYACLGFANTSLCLWLLCLFADSVLWTLICSYHCGVFASHFFASFSSAQAEGKSVSVSVPAACVGEHSLISHRQESHKAK